jgi:uncharacterized membrane protein
MDRMLVVVFDNESKAYEGKKALQQLAGEGSIGLYASAVLTKNADGTSSVKQGDDAGPLGTLIGTSFGALIGLLGGPAGAAVGAPAGNGFWHGVDLSNVVWALISSTMSQKLRAEQGRGGGRDLRRMDHSCRYPYGAD